MAAGGNAAGPRRPLRCDAIDATVVCLASDGDDILASGPGGVRALAEAAGIHAGLTGP
jgi:hypothetical protein